MKLGTLRSKIVSNSALLLAIMASATLYTGLASFDLARSVELLFRHNLQMENISKTLNSTEDSLSGYLRTKSSDSLKDYILYSTRLTDQAWVLNREIRADESLLLQRDLSGVLDTYIGQTESSVAAKRGRDVVTYAQSYNDSERTAELARYLIGRVEKNFMEDSLKAFSGFNSRISGVIATNAALVLAATLMSFMNLLRYSYRLTDPLSRLAEAASAVERGDYDYQLPLLESNDEIGTTAQAFSQMRESIRESFDEIHSRSEVERRLMDEKMRVLDMSHKLKEAELLALQTQINPHFLFNTLSAGLQLAVKEEAHRTTDFLENLAVFIRYALKPPSRLVRVDDEIECAERYIWLLRLRFGTRYLFDLSFDPEVLSVAIPALVLQPLIENSVNHGLKNRENGGEIRVTAKKVKNEAVLSVEDTGDGMSADEIQKILADSVEEDGRFETGIGLRNVIRRVGLATNGEGRVELESPAGKGTIVRIRLPIKEKVEA